MEWFKRLGIPTKILLIAGLILIIYGYLCRFINLYFFWESRSLGWVVFLLGLIGVLITVIKVKNKEKKQTLLEKIGIGIIIFGLLVSSLLMIIIPFTAAYSTAIAYLSNNQDIKDRVGNVLGASTMLGGGIGVQTQNGRETGNATINLTLKGEKKYLDLTVYVVKREDSPEWQVEGVK